MLYKEGQEYGIIFCRMIQVYHPDPADIVLSTFLVQIRNDFKKLVGEYHITRPVAE